MRATTRVDVPTAAAFALALAVPACADVPEWQTPAVNAVNRLPAHARVFTRVRLRRFDPSRESPMALSKVAVP